MYTTNINLNFFMVLFLIAGISILFSFSIKAEEVKLSDGIFLDSQMLGQNYLLDLKVDRLMAPYYEALNLEAKADNYGGWEDREISGHSLGHWLSASSQMYNETSEKKLLDKINYAVEELKYLQKQREDGYVGGIPPEIFEKVFSGDFQVDNFSLANYWVPWYNLHKTFAGLIDVYRYTDNKEALEIAKNLADWAKNGTDNLDESEFKRMLISEYGGMSSVLIDLYEITDNKEYFNLALRFNQDNVLQPLKKENDNLTGKHANTQIPKIIGAAKTYKINKKEDYRTIAEYFWDQVVDKRSYVFGGNSRDEHFDPVYNEKLSVTSAETCNTYNMMELAQHLYSWSHDPVYMDYYENALYNHILASQDPDSGMKTYFMSTDPGHFKVYSTPENSFWCCVGTGMENPARYSHNIYHSDENQLYVNLFIASEFSDDRGYKLRQESNFPEESKTKLVFERIGEKDLELKIRVPDWIDGQMKIAINGQRKDYSKEDRYITINENWEEEDVIEIDLPMGINLYESMDDENKIAFKYGPILLAGELGKKDFPKKDKVNDHLTYNNYSEIEVPEIVSNQKDIEKIIDIIDRKELEFEIDQKYLTNGENINLIPFYNLHHQRYTVYWNKYTENEYERLVNSKKNKEEKLNDITLDSVKPDQQQSEIEHNLDSQNSNSDYFAEAEAGWRDARDGGYFSYELSSNKEEEVYLMVSYWGSDGPISINGEEFERKFEIIVEGNSVAEEVLSHNKPDELFSVFYKIPENIVKDKDSIKVKFESSEGKIAGGVFGVRLTTEKL